MNQKFSTYLRDIGLLNETASSSIMKSDEKASNKGFNDSSFDLLMNYFNNLDEEQKKFMSLHIPSKFIIISTKLRHDKLKSILVQINLRKKIVLLKYFMAWKYNINIISEKNESNDVDNNIKLNLINIDNNEDPDNQEQIKNEEEQKSNDNLSNKNISNNDYFLKHISNIRNTFNSTNSENSNYKYINVYQNKNDSDKKSYNLSENIIKSNNKYKMHNSASNRKNSKRNPKESNINVKTHLMTSLEEKEMLELEECYFRPKINKSKKQKGLNLSQNTQTKNKKRQEIFEKLYKYNEKYKLAKELRAIELEKIAGQKITFIPTTIQPKKPKKNTIKKSLSQLDINNPKNNSQNLQKNRVKSEENLNFEERQRNYLIKKRKHSAEIKNQLDSIFNEICSFNPKINSEKNMSNIYSTNKKPSKKKKNKNTVFSRLYNDGKERINTRTKKEQKIINQILEMSNIINPEKNFDFNTINRLYENKEKKHNIKKIIKKVEEEEGTTFKPFISQNNYNKSVNGTFYERNKKLINDREIFCEEENKKLVEYEKKHVIGKDYTKEERQKVINNIINRLYNDSSFIKKSINNSNKK